MTQSISASLETPVGAIVITQSGDAISRIRWTSTNETGNSALLRNAVAQLRAYFAGELADFDLPTQPDGTVFDQAVWTEMRQIPYGRTRTYGSIAHAIGGISRAVGTACGRNPIPIIVPCHRVVGSNGSLGGFSGGKGLPTKRELLAVEGVTLSPASTQQTQLSLF